MSSVRPTSTDPATHHRPRAPGNATVAGKCCPLKAHLL
ncbi:hypothetical protein STRTUCAR8_03974 [Streptomyces turgidiscabies Car8]|uniref:Uncharacterized protein n=1 Tax=Streptomyces turgidiscabies (strain Car8) TaxID=698760 RepID=L7ERA5_STRT8|nr:hypothetical protein STRTUCAR8_03974 [Streptomyces turgidiscabies Car8]